MATATNLTPTEVIDRVRAARKAEQQAAVEELELALEWARLHPCPANETPAHWGEADLHDEGLVPLAGPGAPWVAEFAPVELAAALGITHDAGRQLVADALELAHRLPRLWERVLAGEVPVWRARLIARETTDLSVAGGAVRGPADRRHPAQDRSGAGRPPGPGGPAVLRPRPRPRRRGGSPRQARRLAAPRQRPGHHRHHDDPGHPRRAAVRPDRHPHRRRPQASSATPRTSRSAAHVRSGSSPTPSTHSTCSLAATSAAPSRGARAAAANLYVHLTAADLAADLDRGHRCRLDREARRRHHPAAHRLAHPVRGSRHQDHPAPRPRPQRHRRPSTSTTHPKRCARPWCCATRTASSPAAAATPGPATSTTSPSTYPWKTADHRAKPGPANLAPLCRGHHRVKTHTAWHYKRLEDGSYVWTAPTGHQYRVTPALRRTGHGLV